MMKMADRFFGYWTKSPIAVRTENFIIVWFGVIVGCVIMLAVPTILISSYKIHQPGYVSFFYAFFTWWPIFAVLGAILFFHDFWFNIFGIFKTIFSGSRYTWKRPGAVFYGGFLGSLLLILALSLKYKLSPFYALDFIFIFIPFFHGLSRLACLNFGCCYGKRCDRSNILKVNYFHADSEPVRHGIAAGQYLHPTQVYEMGCCLLIGVFMCFLLGRVGEGKIFAYYLITYGACRFLLELIRDNKFEKVFFNSISIWQLLSLCFVGLGVYLVVVLPGTPRLILDKPIVHANYQGILLVALWNAIVVGITFSLHFRKRQEPL